MPRTNPFNFPLLLGNLFWFACGLFALQTTAQELSRAPQLVVDAEGFTTPVQRMAISDDGRWLAAAADKVTRVWDLKLGSLHATLRGYQEPYGYQVGFVEALCFSPDSRYLIVGVSDNSELGSTRVYDMENPDQLRGLIKGHLGCTRGVTFSSSGKFLATWGCDGNVIVSEWNARTAEATEQFRVDWANEFCDDDNPLADGEVFAFTPDEQWLVYASCTNVVVSMREQRSVRQRSQWPAYLAQLADLQKGVAMPRRQTGQYRTAPAISLVDHDNALAAKPWLVRAGVMDEVGNDQFFAAVWGRDAEPIAVHRHRYEPTAVAWNSQAELAASADRLGEIHVWNPANGKLVMQPLKPVSQPLWNVEWSAGGEKLLFAKESYGSDRFNYNRFGGVTHEFNLNRMHLATTSRTANDRSVATIERDSAYGPIQVAIWHRLTGANIPFSEAPGKFDLFLAREGQRTGINLFPWVWKDRFAAIDKPRLMLSPYTFGTPQVCQFVRYPGMNTDNCLVVGSTTGELLEGSIQDGPNGNPEYFVAKQFVGHTAAITGVAISPDQRYLASSSLDGTIRIWPLKSARVLGDIDCLFYGTKVSLVPEQSQAAAAGLKADDVLQKFDGGTFFERMRGVQAGKYQPGDSIKLQITRKEDGRDVQLEPTVRLGPAPDLVEPLLSIFVSSEGQWVAWTQEGVYDSSTLGANNIGWHINRERDQPAQFFAASQFQYQLYQPKIVRYTMELGDSKAAQERLFKELSVANNKVAPLPIDDYEKFEKYLPPEIEIISPQQDSR